MGEIILQLIPFIIGSAVVPLQIMMVILLLSSRNQGLAKAILLVAGMTVVRLAQGVVFGLVFAPSSGSGGKSPLVSTLLVVLGILLLLSAYKSWRGEDDPDGPPPKWMSILESITPLKAFGAGAGLVLVSGKFWVFTLSAIGVIIAAQPGQTAGILIFLLYVLLAQSLLFLIILIRLVLPRRSMSFFEAVSAWLSRNNRPIVLVVSLVFGLLFLYQGISGLLQV